MHKRTIADKMRTKWERGLLFRMKIKAKKEMFEKTRIVCGLSQRELARRSGLSHAYISLIERGDKTIGPAAAKRLSEALDKPMEVLFQIE